MPGKHTERAFEDAIEHSLVTSGGWVVGDPKTFDRDRALHPTDFLTFVQTTQSDLWDDLSKQHGAALDAGILDALTKSLESRGALDVLRHGFKFYGKKIECAYFRPAHGLNPDILAKYAQNRLVATRQVHFAPADDKDEDKSLRL
jgi:type I restriction enzyme, R subunit